MAKITKQTADLKHQVAAAITACEAKKAGDITALQLDKVHSGFTDYFVICSGSNPRQIQAISDEVEQRLSGAGLRPAHTEGYRQAEWVLLDYVDFVVHIFSEKARKFYDLERLWKSARRLTPSELTARKTPASPRSTRPRAPRSRTRKA
jgi:ribosome-associated protein